MGNQKRKKKLRQKENRWVIRFELRQPTHFRIDGTHKFEIVPLYVTWDPIPDEDYDRLPREVHTEFERLYHLVQESAAEALPGLRELRERYPQISTFRTNLIGALRILRRRDEADAELEQCCRDFPDYLFGPINRALCEIADGNVDAVPEILNHTFDIREWYPDRREFHYTEVLSFYGLLGHYYVKKDKLDVATAYFEFLQDIDPDSNSTRGLGIQIAVKKRPFFGRLMAAANLL